jgi:4-amino-4-deoxy-L-arabinose transferase-like glycosyltransferase
MRTSNSSSWYYLILFLIVGFGFLIRILDLGASKFGSDELFHIYAARSFIETGKPTLPSGFEYSRSFPFTFLVSICFEVFGESEFSARLPSVLFGCSTIILLFYIGKKFFGEPAGMAAAFIASFAVIEVVFSRETRMYSIFQFTNLLFVYLFYLFITSKNNFREKAWWHLQVNLKTEQRTLNLVLLFSIFILAYLNLKLHMLFLVTIFTLIIVTFLFFFIMLPHYRKPLIIIALLGGVTLAIATFTMDPIRSIFKSAFKPLSWAEGNADNIKYYRDYLTTEFPFLFGLLPISLVYLFTKKKKETLFLACLFFIPFSLHSLLPTKAERYIFYILPFMFLAQGATIAYLLKALFGTLKKKISTNYFGNVIGSILLFSLIFSSTSFTLFSTPWFFQSIKYHSKKEGMYYGVAHFDWDSAMEYLNSNSNEPSVVIASLPLYAMYYSKNKNKYYYMNDLSLNIDDPNNYMTENGATFDYASGSEILTTRQNLVDLINIRKEVWFVVEKHRLKNKKAYSKEAINYINKQFELMFEGKYIVIFKSRCV